MRSVVCSLVAILFAASAQAASPNVEPNGKATSNTTVAVTDRYPRITALENAILGQTFLAEELPVRLARMERKAFGSTSDKSYLGERTDALEQYTEQTLHKKLFQPDPTFERETAEDSQADSSPSDYPRITALETAILGQSYAGQPLADRLGRMETKTFGHPSDNPDLSARADALEQYAEKKLHKKLLGPSKNKETASGSSPQNARSQQLMSLVGNSLLGLASSALGVPGILPALAGAGMRVASTPEQKPDPQASSPKEDPALMAAEPPHSGARLLTKVGWCEMRLFGHTFPELHLPERLGQLNSELNYSPGKSNIKLMDEIGALIKTVQAREPSGQSIGTKSQPAVH